MLKQLQEWGILIAGLIVVIGGLLIASSSQNGTPSDNKTTLQAEVKSSQPEKLVQVPAKVPALTPAASAPATSPASSAKATPPASPAQSAPVVHQHMQVAQAPTAAPAATTAVSGAEDATQNKAGRLVFRKCSACHSLEAGKNSLGPSLADIVGKKAGSVAGYNYSSAIRNSNLTWDAATLDAYLTDPQKVVPGNKMPFPGLKTENERRAIIAYLSSGFASSMPATAEPATAPAKSPAAITTTAPKSAAPKTAASAASSSAPAGQSATMQTAPGYLPGVRYTLKSGIAEGRMVFIGVGGTIDGQINPVLSAAEGQVVQVTLINGEGAEHDIIFSDQGPAGSSPHIVGRGSSTNIAFVASKAGDYSYYCSLPGHRLAGMEGQFLITPTPPEQVVVEADISQRSTDVPAPIGKRGQQTVRVDLVTVELEGRLAEGTTFGYWTFNGRVPGPMLRVRVGDTVDVHLKNADGSAMVHSVDFHAATGPGGGAVSTQANPGEEKSFKFKALIPGLYVYHCATPMVAHHIANGMYGLILVEPEEGLPPVDREFYVMQGEIYTEGAFGQHGSQSFDVTKLLNERPEYFVFNGSVGALSKFHPLQAKVGETVRIFFGVGGPNYTSSFHVIGEIFDKVYNLGGILSEPLHGLQTVLVPAGGAVITEFKVDVPGNYTLVDHALARAERGLVGVLHVEGQSVPEIYDGKVEPGSGH